MNFWKGKKVLLTGHTGFKGSWLSLWLQMLGVDLVGFSLQPPTEPSLFKLAEVENGMKSVIADVRDADLLAETLKIQQPDIVFHMAAQPLVRYSYQHPVETYAINVMGTVHLLEAVRKAESVRAVINVTTDKCYENQEWCWGYRENDRLGGHDPYSNSKACAELVTAAYRDSFLKERDIGLASVRAGNVIGGGDWAEDRLVPDIVRACMAKRPVSIRYPEALRPWQYVLEPLNGYLLLAKNLYQSPSMYDESWNFGPGGDDVKPVRWIVDFLSKKFNCQQSWQQDQAQHPHEANYLKLDCSKAASRLGWRPRWNLAKGLEQTADWYQAYQSCGDMRDITLSQIKHFISHTITMREHINVESAIY